MLEKIKWFTQRVTFILQAIICLGFAAGAIKLLDLFGLWIMIDSLYSSNLFLFWVAIVTSRFLFAAGCGYVWETVITWGRRTGYFSIEPERHPDYSSDSPDPTDKSGYVLGIPFLCALLTMIAEFCIRFVTWTIPVYVTPMS